MMSLQRTRAGVRLLTGQRSRTNCISSFAYNKSSASARLVSWSLFLIHALFWLALCHRKGLVFCITNPPVTHWVGLLLRLVRGERYIVFVWDLYPDILIQRGYLRHDSIALRVWRWVDTLAYTRASRIITISSQMADRIQLHHPLVSPKLRVIPTWVDTTIVSPISKCDNQFLIRNSIHEKVTLVFSGNLADPSILCGLIESIGVLRLRTSISLSILGSGFDCLKPIVGRWNLDSRVRFYQRQSDHVYLHALASADISVVPLPPDSVACMMPSKLYYSMAVGSAILAITTPESDLSSTVHRFACGESFLPSNVSGLSDFLLRCHDDSAFLNRMKENARLSAVRHFDVRNVIPNLLRTCAGSG